MAGPTYKTLWDKPGALINQEIMSFLAGDDVSLDRELMAYDIQGSRAHAEGLQHIGILTEAEVRAIVSSLAELETAVETGAFVLDGRFEDSHSAIEFWLTEKLGPSGEKIHTGRSRNDQVLVATRLYLKDRLLELKQTTTAIAQTCLDRAQREANIPVAGYTHLQRAVVSTLGVWWAGYAETFIDSVQVAADAIALVDANPLGTAAGFGVNLPLDRDYTTQALGFSRLHVNPVAAQLSRGKYEWHALTALATALGDMRRMAWDLSLFTTSEFGFVKLPPEYMTGSSIMPNKRNPDVIELMRASQSVALGAMAEMQALLSLPSGYQRDLQFSKGPLLRAMRHGLRALALLPDLLRRLKWNEKKMRAAIEPAMFATDLAIEKAMAGMPFRQAYLEAVSAREHLSARTIDQSLDARVSPGSAGDLRLHDLHGRLRRIG